MFAYSVTCEFTSDDATDVRSRWLQWLEEEHLAEVIAAGAMEATVYIWDGSPLEVETIYTFSSRQAFEVYERDFAPHLRAKGLDRFPPDELGLRFSRRIGMINFADSSDPPDF